MSLGDNWKKTLLAFEKSFLKFKIIALFANLQFPGMCLSFYFPFLLQCNPVNIRHLCDDKKSSVTTKQVFVWQTYVFRKKSSIVLSLFFGPLYNVEFFLSFSSVKD